MKSMKSFYLKLGYIKETIKVLDNGLTDIIFITKECTQDFKGMFGRVVWVMLFVVFWNTYKWKSVWKYVQYCLKCKNVSLRLGTKQALSVCSVITNKNGLIT